jgi:hypothetical protein
LFSPLDQTISDVSPAAHLEACAIHFKLIVVSWRRRQAIVYKDFSDPTGTEPASCVIPLKRREDFLKDLGS